LEKPTENTLIITCPICGSDNLKKHLELKDYSISKETFSLVKCESCSFVITNPRPSNNDLSRYYESEDYISHSGTKKGLINSLYHKFQKLNLKLKYKAIAKYVPRGTWMDYGAGNGAFLNFLKSKNLSSEGYEPDEKARKLGNSKGVKIENSTNYKKSSKQYAAISMWHVLEHIPELNEIIEIHKSNLIENGIICIAVPNRDSYDAKFYKAYWAAYDVPRHLWHFTETDVVSIMAKHGFKHITTKGMPFDAYYVSMLSEKFKNGFIIRALALGALSNLKARFSNAPFSSQIYVFKKKSI